MPTLDPRAKLSDAILYLGPRSHDAIQRIHTVYNLLCDNSEVNVIEKE
jgi:hypothetical protein